MEFVPLRSTAQDFVSYARTSSKIILRPNPILSFALSSLVDIQRENLQEASQNLVQVSLLGNADAILELLVSYGNQLE